MIIYCRPPVEKILNFGSREQMAGVIERAERLIKEYDRLMFNVIVRKFEYPVLVYDYTCMKLDTIMTVATRRAGRRMDYRPAIEDAHLFYQTGVQQ